MKLGTTPTHVFELSCNIEVLSNVKIIYAQNGKVILVKHLRDCEVDLSKNTLTVVLTQEETFMFTSDEAVEIQLRALTLDDDAVASDIYSVSVTRCLDNEVLV